MPPVSVIILQNFIFVEYILHYTKRLYSEKMKIFVEFRKHILTYCRIQDTFIHR
jgi:hypothetical protein